MRPVRPVAGMTFAGGLLLAGAVAVAAPSASAASASQTITLKSGGSVTMTARGNGHGHGLSQYGAYGAALAGLNTAQILAHYYPGTSLATKDIGWLRVKLSGTGTATTVWATPDLHVGTSTLPSSGVKQYRLVADSGSTLTLQRLTTAKGAAWTTYRTNLANNSQFQRPGGAPIRTVRDDGTTSGSTYYAGYLRAVRASATGTSGGVRTVNVIGSNAYAQGVAPREMPAGWSLAAVQAQAIAARTYAAYEKAHAGTSYYDICDTSACQVYGGQQHLDASGNVRYTDFPAAVAGLKNRLLTYRGAAIFAQYSASNGGYMADGGQPYLRAGVDKYDPGRSGDPYIDDQDREKVSTVARDYGLSTITRIVLTRESGAGWKAARVVSATLYGSGSQRTTVSGDSLGWEFGFGTTLYTLAAS